MKEISTFFNTFFFSWWILALNLIIMTTFSPFNSYLSFNAISYICIRNSLSTSRIQLLSNSSNISQLCKHCAINVDTILTMCHHATFAFQNSQKAHSTHFQVELWIKFQWVFAWLQSIHTFLEWAIHPWVTLDLHNPQSIYIVNIMHASCSIKTPNPKTHILCQQYICNETRWKDLRQ